MKAKSSTKNQRRRQKYDDLASKSRTGQHNAKGNQGVPSANGLEATLDAVRAVAPRRHSKQRQAASQRPPIPAKPAPARSMLKELSAGIPESSRQAAGPQSATKPSPMSLVKPHQLEAIHADRPRCAIPRCKEQDDICSFDKVTECLEQRSYREALDRFIS